MAIEGPLKELNIHDVFQLLDLGRKTGVLRVTSELRQNAGVVYFERGAVIAALISSNPHPLGEMLLRSGKISDGDLARARAVQAAGDARRLGEILVGIEAVSRRELERCVRAQVEEVVFELMSWSEGYFSFVDGAADHQGVEATASIPTEALLMEAARRIDEWARIETKIPHLGVVPRLKASDQGAVGPLDLVPFEWEVLAAVDGQRDLRDIAEELGRSEFDVARTIYGLTAAGVVELDGLRPGSIQSSTAERPAPQGVSLVDEHLALGDFDAARAAAEALVAAAPEKAEHRMALGRALLALGLYDEAEAVLETALHLGPQLIGARRLLGLAQAGMGRYADALESWDRWARATPRRPEEDARSTEVERLRAAVAIVLDALRGRHV